MKARLISLLIFYIAEEDDSYLIEAENIAQNLAKYYNVPLNYQRQSQKPLYELAAELVQGKGMKEILPKLYHRIKSVK